MDHHIDNTKRDIEDRQEMLMQELAQAEKELCGVLQQLELHIKTINELTQQTDNLMKELTTYDEHNTVQKLNIARAEI